MGGRACGGRTAPAPTSWTIVSSGARARPTAGRSAVTSSRSGFGACGPDAIKAARPLGLSTAKDFCTASPPTISKTASQLLTTRTKSCAL
jgi:hypothetical protein